MTKIVAFASQLAASIVGTTLTSCAILALSAFSVGGAQTFAETPPSSASAAPIAPIAPIAPKLNAQQLEALTAPIAAYPDPLLAQVLMAATFPDDVAAAAAWSKSHPDLSGEKR
jgi:hypothetical protein